MSAANLTRATPVPSAPAQNRPGVAIVEDTYRDAYLVVEHADEAEVSQFLVPVLESAGLRPICAWEGRNGIDETVLTRLIERCSLVVAASGWDGMDGTRPSRPELRIARTHKVPVIEVRSARKLGTVEFEGLDGQPVLEQIRGLPLPSPQRLYAFMAVRIHDDFQLVREAIRVAVEAELGIPCVYFEDRRVLTSIAGVRDRTRELIRQAAFFVADLSYSPSNPDYDSPNTAHEIGMAIAYGIPLVVSVQAPRRNLYFSAGDLDTLFWKDESDLAEQLRAWLRPRRDTLGRRVLSFESPSSRFGAPQLRMDPQRRYTGPFGRRRLARMLFAAKVILATATESLNRGQK